MQNLAWFVLSAVWLVSNPARGGNECESCVTVVPGPSVIGETWTKAGSPYCVTGDISVSGLTIEPGVCVLVDGPYVIVVQTPITAIGTEEEPIVFTEKDPDDNWKGLSFGAIAPGSVLQYCWITNSTESAMRIDTGPGGSAPLLDHCRIRDSSGAGGGLSIELANGELILNHCLIEGNTSTSFGGGVKAIVENANLVMNSCVIQGNASASHGGGVNVAVSGSGTLQMNNCHIIENMANPSNSNGNFVGGGIRVDGLAQLSDCVIADNTCFARCSSNSCDVMGRGGGVYVGSGSLTADRCTVRDNLIQAQETGSGGSETSLAWGGGVYVHTNGMALFRSSLITCNTTSALGTTAGQQERGAGIYVNGGELQVDNCTIANNSSHGVWQSSGTVIVDSSIVYFNNGNGTQVFGAATITNSDVQGGFDGDGNICLDPDFLGDPVSPCVCPDYRISPFSPCVDSGNPVEQFNDASCDPHPWNGGERNDMGAYGGPGACGWTCWDPADVNCDRLVDVDDLVKVILNWGPCPTSDCPSDTNCSGTVDVDDLVKIILGWT